MELRKAATNWLNTLDAEQRARAKVRYSDHARLDWQFVPRPVRKGVSLAQMSDRQREAAMEILRHAVSASCFEKIERIREQQRFLHETENRGSGCGAPDQDGCLAEFNPDDYFFTVFNEPSSKGEWGLSFEGHHVSINISIADDVIRSVTPFSLGSWPHDDPVLRDEDRAAIELLESFSDDERRVAIVSSETGDNIWNSGGPYPYAMEPFGLAAGRRLRSLIEIYTSNFSDRIAAAWMNEIDFAKVHFGFWGTPGGRREYRVQGPIFLIEFSCVQHEANHVHTVLRDLRGDFGITNPFFRRN